MKLQKNINKGGIIMSVFEIILLIAGLVLVPLAVFTYIKYWKHNRYGGKFKDNFPNAN